MNAKKKKMADSLLVTAGPNAGGRFGFRVSPELDLQFTREPVEVPKFHEYEVNAAVPNKACSRGEREVRPVTKRVNLHSLLKPYITAGKLDVVG